MARTHSSYTASPTRSRSPRYSPTRRPSKDGSEYEMDLDALGLNSTFESSELQASYEPPVDRVDTSEIEGPEDFTMNMTYWMTADLPLAQIKSRKEAKGRVQEMRTEVVKEESAAQDTTEEGVVEGTPRLGQDGISNSASTTRRAHGTTDERAYSTPESDRSMENDEKVRSFLSNLPDTEMEGAIAGTPLHIPKQSFLQIPRSSPPKARSLQATVEDYDTPRKPTQETVIHHTSAVIESRENDAMHKQITELKSRLSQQEIIYQTRITELETIVSYTRAELDNARTDGYKQKERATGLEQTIEQQMRETAALQLSTQAESRAKEEALDSRLQEYGEEMHLQNLSKLQSQQKDFERQLQALADSKHVAEQEIISRDQTLKQVRSELNELRRIHEKHLQEKTHGVDSRMEKNPVELAQQMSSVQALADDLQAQLERAIAETKAVREDAEQKDMTRHVVEAQIRARTARITELETHLQTARFQLECAQADVSAKEQLFRTNMDLNSRLRTMQYELTARGQRSMRDAELEDRIESLRSQLHSSREEILTKNKDILHYVRSQEQLEQNLNTAQGRIEGLEATGTMLRQQLAEAHRENAKARTNSERLERDLEDANERLQDAHTEADRRVADVEQKLNRMKECKLDAERKFRELDAKQADLLEGHEVMLEDVRDKAEDAVRKAGALLEQERSERRRIIKKLERTKDELAKSRAENLQILKEEEESDDGETSMSSLITKDKDKKTKSLREVIRNQVSETKTLKTEISTLRKESKKLKLAAEAQSELEANMSDLKHEISTLRTQNANLQANLEDQEAVNKAMDEKLAKLVSKMMKERAKTVVGRRDGQWQESMEQVQQEKELLGKVLLRQWGREEVGIADEQHGEEQMYRYKYAKRGMA